jgi:hypothetical protein
VGTALVPDRLVADDEPGAQGRHAGDGDALALAAGEFAGQAGRGVGGKADAGEQVADPAACLRGADAVAEQRFGQGAISISGCESAGQCACEPSSHGLGWRLVAEDEPGAEVELAGGFSDLVEPGLAQVPFWRPDTPPPARFGEIGFYGGVARKPGAARVGS